MTVNSKTCFIFKRHPESKEKTQEDCILGAPKKQYLYKNQFVKTITTNKIKINKIKNEYNG